MKYAVILLALLAGCQVVSGPCKVEVTRNIACEADGTVIDILVVPTPILK